MSAIQVLNHGSVRLVEALGSDLSIVRAARVSYAADWRAGEDQGSDSKLINYLLKNHHTSPFEAVVLTFEVAAPIFVFRQWHRHRTWSFNEVSARYSELPETFYVPEAAVVGVQSANNKQVRDIKDLSEDESRYAQASANIIWAQCMTAFKVYRELLQRGVPRELARGVLPVNTYSRMFATVDLHNLFHFLRLRAHSHAQYEIRVYAEAMMFLAAKVAPVAVQAFKTHILGEPSGTKAGGAPEASQ